ncbi:hypothetical protein ACQKP0_04950 [Heyndrickxia sp. NPDC080065]|uniref:hypothetical protein n=1 Tax=Heyndrickxia sp. NPDC080065 TaxID=3390568 RepID=UPI003D04DD02
MSNQKREKVIHVDKLIIHAKEVEIIQEHHAPTQPERRNPWDFFMRRPPITQENIEVSSRNTSGEQRE